ncbi:MAG: Gfo/Idh/MocA family protein [Chloroflexota bacterium]
MPRYGVLLVGGKRTHQESYGRAFAADPRCRVVAVADEPGLSEYREGLNRLLAHEMGVPYLVLEDALRRDDIDIVSGCADVERRGRVHALCAQAGKHLYLDKPLAGSVDDARSIAVAVATAGVASQMYTHVTLDWARRAKTALESGAIGELTGIHADMLMAKGRAGTAPADLVRHETESPELFTFVEAKRELFDMGVYPIALIHWLTDLRASSVSAVTGNYFFAEHARQDVEDFGALTLRLEDGTPASVSAGRIGFDSQPSGGVNRVVLTGTRGYAVFADGEPYVEVYNDDPAPHVPEPHPWDPMTFWPSTQQEISLPRKRRRIPLTEPDRPAPVNLQAVDVTDFLDCLDEKRRPEVDARAAVHHVEVIMAAYRAAATGETVEVQEAKSSAALDERPKPE